MDAMKGLLLCMHNNIVFNATKTRSGYAIFFCALYFLFLFFEVYYYNRCCIIMLLKEFHHLFTRMHLHCPFQVVYTPKGNDRSNINHLFTMSLEID